jgi:hypothetical protein
MLQTSKRAFYSLYELAIVIAVMLQTTLILLPFYQNKIYLSPEDDIYSSIGISDVQPFSWPLVGDFLMWVAIFSGFINPIIIVVFSLRLLSTIVVKRDGLPRFKIIYWSVLIMAGLVVSILTWVNRVRIVNWLTD